MSKNSPDTGPGGEQPLRPQAPEQEKGSGPSVESGLTEPDRVKSAVADTMLKDSPDGARLVAAISREAEQEVAGLRDAVERGRINYAVATLVVVRGVFAKAKKLEVDVSDLEAQVSELEAKTLGAS